MSVLIIFIQKAIVQGMGILFGALGEILTEENLAVKRPGNGISPMRWYEVIGTKAIRDFSEDEMIEC